MRARHFILLALLLGAGCAHQPQPYTFTTAASAKRATVDRIASSLARQGHAVATVDRGAAQVTTFWEDTHYRFRASDDLEDETTVFLRYHVGVAPAAGGAPQQVVVRAEAQRCVPYRAVITRGGVKSTCVPMEDLFATQQRTIDELGRTLAASLANPG